MSDGIQVIGAGLPRTGTLTQKLALEQLGFGPAYHWVNLLADLDQIDVWNRALDGEGPWEEVFTGFHSTVDWPGGYFYKELADAYPDAKVLLSVRDPVKWERSFRETIVALRHGESLMRLLASARGEIDPQWRRYLELVDRMFYGPQGSFRDGWAEPEQLVVQMQRHHEQVQATIAPERLLVWEVGEGWAPLCEFLDVPVPDEPLPHENDRETFLGRVTHGAIAALAAWSEQQQATAAGG
jgi:hypothetical protein